VTKINGCNQGVALIEGWANIPDAIEIWAKKRENHLKPEYVQCVNNQVVFVSRKYVQKHLFCFFTI